MQVKILTSISSPEWGAPNVGSVVEIPDDEARRLIAAGYAAPGEKKKERAVRSPRETR